MKVNSLTFEISPANSTALPSKDSPPSKAPSREVATTVDFVGAIPGNQPPVEKPVINGYGMSLEFAFDESTRQYIIRVYDVETGKIVRQIPPDEVLNFLRQYESQNGPVLSRKL